jgi:hypothetical protein
VVAKGSDRTGSARTVGALAILGLLTSGAAAQTPAVKADAVKATGVFPVTAETSLVIRGLPGQVVVTTKPARELRFTSRAKDKSGSERALGVWFSGTTVTIAPPPGTTLPEGILRVEAPASFAVRVESRGGMVLVDGFAGAVGILGRGTVARAQALVGPLDADVEGGSLSLTNLGGMVTARLGAASTLAATNLRGGLDLKSQDATFKVQGVTGACRVESRGGSGELAGLAAGGDLRLSESALRLTGGHGDVTVTSDAPVVFSNMAASMRFEMDGGTLRGNGNQGPVEVRARRTDVDLEAIVGALRVEGEGLKTKLVGISGELNLNVTRGNVLLQRASGPVTAVIFAGDAQLYELQGAVRLDIEGGNAELSWAAITGDKDTFLENRGGDITVRLPASASCRVTAKTKSGRITSDISSIKIPANATEAQGALGQGQGPLIAIEANGNIHLSASAKSPAAPS